MGASEDWARTRELRQIHEKQPVRVKAKYRVRCKKCGIMMNWPCNDICPDCLKEMSAPVGAGHGQCCENI